LRITRVCTKPVDREARFSELKYFLLEQKYSTGLIDASIRRTRAIPRAEALKRVDKTYTPNTRPIFAVTWDPRLPNLSDIGMKHWRSMTFQDVYLGKVFSDPPIIAYERQRNIADS
jgi:hypothetical protein